MTGAITLLTRDKGGNQRLEVLLDIPTASFDLYDIVYEKIAPQSPATPCIITSRHAAAAAVKSAVNASAFYVVGEEAKTIIQQAGLGDVAYCAEHVDMLTNHLIKLRPPTLTYLRGEIVRQDIASLLTPHGINVSDVFAYKINKNASELNKLRQFIASPDSPLIVPLLSVQSAGFLADVLFLNKVASQQALHAVAISDVVRDAVRTYDWASLHVCRKRNLSSIAEACMNRYDGISI